MSKRYSGKSFKDLNTMKKSKLSFKEKIKLKKKKKRKKMNFDWIKKIPLQKAVIYFLILIAIFILILTLMF